MVSLILQKDQQAQQDLLLQLLACLEDLDHRELRANLASQVQGATKAEASLERLVLQVHEVKLAQRATGVLLEKLAHMDLQDSQVLGLQR